MGYADHPRNANELILGVMNIDTLSLISQIEDKVKDVKDARSRLQTAWLDRKRFYDQIFDLHIFLRDAEQLNTISASQEVTYISTL